ncbi:DUF3667 domain-containing protein [Hymenobacter lapidiphilus]|uniref:DUF3667 domain-containing protein n=1 Tax=Hymenobacter sp. CCM 8763 TaxID=2303334 RepID=UPI00167E7620|nr:DUF3667 domain-containing protein [Hymenobacter sp. CCM 8763]
MPDRYCGRCGQDAHHTHRLTMADMPHDILHSIWHVDKGILYTLKTMIVRPGATIRAYLAGKRVDHFRPLSLLFMITGFYALLSALLHIDLMGARDPSVPEAVWQMQVKSTTFFAKYMSWCYVAMVPVWALFARLFLKKGGYNYAECLIIAAFITAISNFFAIFLLPILYYYNGTPQIKTVTFIYAGFTFAYVSWAYSTLLKHTAIKLPGRLWRGFMTFFLGYLTCVLVITLTTYALNWSMFKASMKAQMEQQAQAAKAAKAAKPM